MLRSRIFALGSLRVGHKHLAADLYRFIGISATPSALWPGRELRKYHYRSTRWRNYSIFKEHECRHFVQRLSPSGELSFHLV